MSLLALQSLDGSKPCAKRWRADGEVESYPLITWWRPLEATAVNNIDRLFEALQRLGKRRDLCVIRGAARDPSAKRIRRKTRDEGDIVDVDRPWLVCDFDNLSTAGREGLQAAIVADPDEGLVLAADYARASLPVWLRTATMVARWSQSAGRDGFAKAKIHLWFWLSRAVCSASLSEYVTANTHLDPSVCRPVQPIYTADPIIEDGWTAGPRERVKLIRGTSDTADPSPKILSLDDWRADRAAKEEQRKAVSAKFAEANMYRSPMALRQRGARRMYELTTKAVGEIAGAPEGRRHATLIRSAASIVRVAREVGIDPQPDLDAIANAARARLPASRANEVSEALRYVLETA